MFATLTAPCRAPAFKTKPAARHDTAASRPQRSAEVRALLAEIAARGGVSSRDVPIGLPAELDHALDRWLAPGDPRPHPPRRRGPRR
jgi:hypothetical protein